MPQPAPAIRPVAAGAERRGLAALQLGNAGFQGCNLGVLDRNLRLQGGYLRVLGSDGVILTCKLGLCR